MGAGMGLAPTMSIKAMNWAFKQTLHASQKAVLVALADNCNDEGVAWPSIQFLVNKTCMSRSTIKRHLKALSEQGYITVQERHRANGSQQSNNIYLNLDKGGVQNEPGGSSHVDPLEPPYEPISNKRRVLPPKNLQMTEETKAWFSDNHSEVNQDEFVKHFVDSCHAKGLKYVNFQLALKNWMTNQKKWERDNGRGKTRQPPDVNRTRDKIREAFSCGNGEGRTS